MLGALAAHCPDRLQKPGRLVQDGAGSYQVQDVAMLAADGLVDQAHQVPSAPRDGGDRAAEELEVTDLQDVLQGGGNLPPFLGALQDRMPDAAAVVAVPQLPLALPAAAAVPFAFLLAGNKAGKPYSGRKFFLSASPRVMVECTAAQSHWTNSFGARA